ncbi:MAG: aldo/keto reductase [Salinarimonas sp.]
MRARRLGDLTVSAIGLGCMGMTPIYGTPDPAEAVATIRRALDPGVCLLDTADAYAGGANERLVRVALKGRREGARSPSSGRERARAQPYFTAR